MRRFTLQRDVDESGLSGTGEVAEGVQFWNGQVAITWISPLTAVSVFPSLDVFERVHVRTAGSIHWIDKKRAPQLTEGQEPPRS